MTSPERPSRVNKTNRSTPRPRRRRKAFARRRRMIGWTQQNFAAAVGVDPDTVSRWERGLSEPSLWVRDAIAEHLKVSAEELDDLIHEDDKPTPIDSDRERTGRQRKRRIVRRKRRGSRGE